MVALDTSALLYLTIDPTKLSELAREAINAADRLIISSISVWEIAQKVSRARLEIGPTIEEYVDGLFLLDRLEIVPVDVDIWLLAVKLDWKHRDPADRVIVAMATILKCPLLTSDRVIAGFYPSTVW